MPESDVALLEQAVREAGAIAKAIYDRPHKTWSKKDGSPVTEADLAVNRFLNEALRTGEKRGTISDLAMSWGFTHMGRFSVEYRRHFGETPSETLKRKR